MMSESRARKAAPAVMTGTRGVGRGTRLRARRIAPLTRNPARPKKGEPLQRELQGFVTRWRSLVHPSLRFSGGDLLRHTCLTSDLALVGRARLRMPRTSGTSVVSSDLTTRAAVEPLSRRPPTARCEKAPPASLTRLANARDGTACLGPLRRHLNNSPRRPLQSSRIHLSMATGE